MKSAAARFLLVLITLIALGRIAGHEFINWDDPYTITANPQIAHPTLSSVAGYWKRGAMGLWIPLTYTLWAGLAELSRAGGTVGDPNPWIFHAASIVIHIISVLAVFNIIRKLLPARSAWPACAGALVFAIHPLQVEAVAWASGMKDLLAGALALLAIDRHLQKSDRRRFDVLAILCFALALLAKPSAIVAIPMLAVIEKIFLDRTWRAIALWLLPWCIVALPIAVIARIAQSTVGVPPIPVLLRPLIAGDAIAFYLWKLVLPIKLAPDYGRMATRIIERGWIRWTWSIPLLLGALILIVRKRSKPLAAGSLIFVAGLLPVLSFTPFLFQFYSTVADHYVYLPMLGVAIAVAWTIEKLNHAIVNIASISVIAVLCILTMMQVGRWRDSGEIFRHTLRVNPQSVASENNLGAFFAANGDYSRAIVHYDHALSISPTYRLAHSNLAQLYALTGKMDLAFDQFEIALALWDQTPAGLSPRDSTSEHLQFAILLEKFGRPTEAARHLDKVLAAQPNNVEARTLLNKLRRTKRTATTTQ